MNGGTLNSGGFGLANPNATLGLTTASLLYFGAGSGTALTFANSAALSWSGVLNLADWAGNRSADGGTSTDTLQIGVDATGLTSAQLADIEFDGNAGTLGEAELDSNGYIMEVVPEPSTLVLGALGDLGLLWGIRRRSA